MSLRTSALISATLMYVRPCPPACNIRHEVHILSLIVYYYYLIIIPYYLKLSANNNGTFFTTTVFTLIIKISDFPRPYPEFHHDCNVTTFRISLMHILHTTTASTYSRMQQSYFGFKKFNHHNAITKNMDWMMYKNCPRAPAKFPDFP